MKFRLFNCNESRLANGKTFSGSEGIAIKESHPALNKNIYSMYWEFKNDGHLINRVRLLSIEFYEEVTIDQVNETIDSCINYIKSSNRKIREQGAREFKNDLMAVWEKHD